MDCSIDNLLNGREAAPPISSAQGTRAQGSLNFDLDPRPWGLIASFWKTQLYYKKTARKWSKWLDPCHPPDNIPSSPSLGLVPHWLCWSYGASGDWSSSWKICLSQVLKFWLSKWIKHSIKLKKKRKLLEGRSPLQLCCLSDEILDLLFNMHCFLPGYWGLLFLIF